VRGEVPLSVPGAGWYVAAAGAVLGGIVLAVALIAWLFLGCDEGTQFIGPGRVSVELRPGAHLVWNDHRSSFEGRVYDSPQDVPPAARIRVRDAGGREIATRHSGQHTTKTKHVDRSALLSFEVAQPGRVEIIVDGAFAPRIFSVSRDQTLRSFGAVAGALAAILIGLAAGFTIWMWAFFKRDAAAEKSARAAAPAQAPASAAAVPEEAALRQLVAIVYGLQLAGYFTGISPIAGVVINYMKRDAAAGTWLESHFRWQIRSFWIALAWSLVGVLALFVFVGIFILGITAMWFMYRGIKGWIELSEGKPMY
jgi:uncharacterized membrane protein